MVKGIINTETKASSAIEQLKGEPDPKVAVNKINTFFAGIGRDLAEKHANFPLISNTYSRDTCPLNSLVLLPTDEPEVESIIRGLRKDSAVGFNGISSRLIQGCSQTFVPSTTTYV